MQQEAVPSETISSDKEGYSSAGVLATVNPTKLTKTTVEDGGRAREALHPELLPNAKAALIDETQVHS